MIGIQSSAYIASSSEGFAPIPPSRRRARSCSGVASVVNSNVAAAPFAGAARVRQVFRTTVSRFSISVRKLWAAVPSGSLFVDALRFAAADFSLGATGGMARHRLQLSNAARLSIKL